MFITAPAKGASTRLVLALGLILCFQTVDSAFGQAPTRFGRIEDTETNIDAFYYLVEPGAATIQISAFGDIINPGVYVLEDGANLALLLALGGGPVTSNQPDIKETTMVRMFRNTGNVRSLAYEASFEEVMDRAANAPALSEGDIIILDVERKRRMNWRDVFTVIGPILSTLLLVERLTTN